MGSNRNTMPAPAAYGLALKKVVMTFYTAEWVNAGMIQGIPNIRSDIERFDASLFIKNALKKGDLVEVPNGSNGQRYRLNLKSRNVIRAAMEVGKIADKTKAEEKAVEIHDDADLFAAFCQEVYRLSSDWFKLTAFEDQIRKDLELDKLFWPLGSLELLMKALASYAPKMIFFRGASVNGYEYRIVLPEHLMLDGQPSNQTNLDDEDEDADDEGVSSAAPEQVGDNEEYTDDKDAKSMDASLLLDTKSSAALPFPRGLWSSELMRLPSVQIFFLRFIDTAGPDGWKRTTALRAALLQHEGWQGVHRGITGAILKYLEGNQWVKKRGANKGREYQLTDKGREALAQLVSLGRSVHIQSVATEAEPEPELESLTTCSAEQTESSPITDVAPEGSPEDVVTETTAQIPSAEYTTVAEVEAALKAKEDQILQSQARRRELSELRQGLKRQLQVLEAEDSELSQMADWLEKEQIYLQQEFTRLQHEEEARRRELETKVDQILAGLDERTLELLKAKLSVKG